MNWFIRINSATDNIKKEPVPEKNRLSGGRNLIAQILNDEIDPACEPLGSGNKLVICPGLLGGTTAPSCGRLSVGAKSPLTGGIKEANVGGTAGNYIARHGIKAIILEDTPQDDLLKILVIRPEGITLEPDKSYVGLKNYELFEKLRANYGEEIAIISIGLAGERGYANSSIAVTDTFGRPTRHAGRGGMGAVMASKGIKAIVIEKPKGNQVEVADQEAFRKAARSLSKAIVNSPATGSGGLLHSLGTPGVVNVSNSIQMLPTRNYSSGVFEGAENISGEKLVELQKERGGIIGHGCQVGCLIKCSNVYHDAEGNYVTSALEYETIALLGSNCGISDLDAIAFADRTCDDMGLDTMETGVAIGIAMDAGLAEFGDVIGYKRLLDEIVKGTIIGNILGQGAATTAKVLGVKRIPVVKGQAMAAYDPRGMKGTGVTYATSPMGADHTAGITWGSKDHHKKEGQVQESKGSQKNMTVYDCLGFCNFINDCFDTPQIRQYVPDMINAMYGTSLDNDGVQAIGADCLKLEKEFNKRCGFTKAHDRIPEFFYKEKLPPSNSVFDITPDEMQEVNY